MKKLLGPVFLFITILFLLSSLGYSLQESLYRKVVVIEDKNEVLKKVSDSLPVEAIIHHEKWGVVNITDEVLLYSIISYIDLIKKENDPLVVSENKRRTMFSGTIRYFNGVEHSFHLENAFTFDELTYGQQHDTPILSAFRTHLLRLFYSSNHFADFIQEAKDVFIKKTVADPGKRIHEKVFLTEKLRQAYEIKDTSEIQQLTFQKQQPLGIITVYKNGKQKSNDRNDILNFIVYDTYFIVQYLGDDNGNSIYMTGRLAELL
ncbi:DUF3919 family protein [Brevibacterium sp. JNUCC-42]|nr:DUF3919 family protein [Brevibacterium sp. JNUCC-42]